MTTKRPSFKDMIAFLEKHGPPPDTRPEASTAGLVERYPELADVRTEDIAIDGPHGDVPARLYEGSRADADFVWLHGGAWVAGTLDDPEANWVGLMLAAARIRVLSADYRKALHGMHHPVLLDDAEAAWEWAATNFNGATDSARGLYLGGASAGGNLAAGLAMRLRDRGGRMPTGLALAYPALHPELPPLSSELQAAVEHVPAEALFTPDVYRAIAANYAGTNGATDAHAFPGVGELAGMPATYILNSERDTLRASGELFGTQLAEAGVDVDVDMEPGAYHGHLSDPLKPFGRKSLDRMAEWIHRRSGPLSDA